MHGNINKADPRTARFGAEGHETLYMSVQLYLPQQEQNENLWDASCLLNITIRENPKM